MTVYDLNRDQLIELKQNYYSETYNNNPSYDELADVDNLVSDQEIYDEYAGTDFVPDDFFCSAGQEQEPEDEEYSFGTDLSGTREYIVEQLRLIADDIESGNYGGLAGGWGASWGLERI